MPLQGENSSRFIRIIFNVTVPAEIALLSFNYTGGDYSELYAEVKGSRGGSIESSGDYINFDIDEWHPLLKE